eukprot:1159985-Pelagomonas_calceolata.AAC.7
MKDALYAAAAPLSNERVIHLRMSAWFCCCLVASIMDEWLWSACSLVLLALDPWCSQGTSQEGRGGSRSCSGLPQI